MLYLPISRNWMLSSFAQRVYFACALLSLAMSGIVIATLTALAISGGDSFDVAPPVALVLRLVLWPCVMGTAVLSIAMWYFWFSFDDSGWLKKTLWFVLLYLIIAVGPILYYFFVYRRSGMLEGPREG